MQNEKQNYNHWVKNIKTIAEIYLLTQKLAMPPKKTYRSTIFIFLTECNTIIVNTTYF